MTKIPCEVIKDLLPSYIDGLTDPVTNEIIEEHLSTCTECRKLYETMKEGDQRPPEDPIEIEFLKVTRMKTNQRIAAFLAVTLAGILLVVGMARYAIGKEEPADRIQAYVQESDGALKISGTLPDGRAVRSVSCSEEGDLLNVEVSSVAANPVYRSTEFQEIHAAEAIRTVAVNGRIVWQDGRTISARTAAVWETVHPYVGDMSANARTAMAAGVPQYFGPFTNELQTAAEPYGWTIILEEPLYDRKAQELQMDRIAAVLIACTGNLSEVTFRYSADGMDCTRTIAEQDADALAGFHVKDAAESCALLQRLIEY